MSTRPPNVVVLTDQQRWDTTGVHADPAGAQPATPVFDRMARGGTLIRLLRQLLPAAHLGGRADARGTGRLEGAGR